MTDDRGQNATLTRYCLAAGILPPPTALTPKPFAKQRSGRLLRLSPRGKLRKRSQCQESPQSSSRHSRSGSTSRQPVAQKGAVSKMKRGALRLLLGEPDEQHEHRDQDEAPPIPNKPLKNSGSRPKEHVQNLLSTPWSPLLLLDAS